MPRTSVSTFTQLLSSGAVLAQSCLWLYSSLQHLVHFHEEYVLLAEVYPIISLVVFHLPAVCRLCVFCLLCFCFCFILAFCHVDVDVCIYSAVLF